MRFVFLLSTFFSLAWTYSSQVSIFNDPDFGEEARDWQVIDNHSLIDYEIYNERQILAQKTIIESKPTNKTIGIKCTRFEKSLYSGFPAKLQYSFKNTYKVNIKEKQFYYYYLVISIKTQFQEKSYWHSFIENDLLPWSNIASTWSKEATHDYMGEVKYRHWHSNFVSWPKRGSTKEKIKAVSVHFVYSNALDKEGWKNYLKWDFIDLADDYPKLDVLNVSNETRFRFTGNTEFIKNQFIHLNYNQIEKPRNARMKLSANGVDYSPTRDRAQELHFTVPASTNSHFSTFLSADLAGYYELEFNKMSCDLIISEHETLRWESEIEQSLNYFYQSTVIQQDKKKSGSLELFPNYLQCTSDKVEYVVLKNSIDSYFWRPDGKGSRYEIPNNLLNSHEPVFIYLSTKNSGNELYLINGSER